MVNPFHGMGGDRLPVKGRLFAYFRYITFVAVCFLLVGFETNQVAEGPDWIGMFRDQSFLNGKAHLVSPTGRKTTVTLQRKHLNEIELYRRQKAEPSKTFFVEGDELVSYRTKRGFWHKELEGVFQGNTFLRISLKGNVKEGTNKWGDAFSYVRCPVRNDERTSLIYDMRSQMIVTDFREILAGNGDRIEVGPDGWSMVPAGTWASLWCGLKGQGRATWFNRLLFALIGRDYIDHV
jgi:hypothetical protein